ncbi:carbohydrate sulfotransferase 5-like [Antedon mediterranea]|uniref:carbohydrate sulfotransferase 5-like n=1 Tax=Antedon mediterranea TaxID=105859 RepID=UPI003AF8E817
MNVAKRAVTLFIFVSMTMLVLLNWISNQDNEFDSSENGRFGKKIIYDYETSKTHQLKGQDTRKGITASASKLKPSYPEHGNVNPSNSHVKVILLGNMRTGSSYVGEIFNQNPDFFYVFEPLHAVDKRYEISPSEQTSSGIVAKYASALRNIPKCKFSSNFVSDLSDWGLSKKMSNDISDLCKKRTRSCKKFSVSEARAFVVQLSRECQSRKHFATKTIRADFSLMKILLEGGMDFKIIQLIRDPRAVANARKNYYKTSVENLIKQSGSRMDAAILNSPNLTLYDVEHSSLSVRTIQSYCKWIWNSMGWIDEKPEWLRNRYKLIRYEDFVMDPIKISKQIYDFIGVPYHERVQSWLVDANKIENTNRDLFQTRKKKSVEELFLWRKMLTYAEIKEVQDTCAGVLQSLGYTKLNNERELKDDNIQMLSSIEFEERR